LSSDLEIAIPRDVGDAPLDEKLRGIGLDAVRRRNNARLLTKLGTLLPLGQPRLLDVGSGPGILLRQADDMGFKVLGIEPDGNTIAAARAQLGDSVRHGYFPQVLNSNDRFDAIVFNDSLEHIRDLDGALSASFQHLAPGGILCLNCPDRRGLYFRVADGLDRLGIGGPYDRLWQKGLASPHAWYFTADNLAKVAERRGFEAVGRLRLDTLDIEGLWARIRSVRNQSIWLSLAAYIFALGSYPLVRILPADAIACFFRKSP
jgi:SAM-dependent methyltransferase